MGSLLDPTISVFYKSHIENKIFKTTITKPKINVCYVDDILIATHSYDETNNFKKNSRKNSELNFTIKLNINKKKIPFLDVLTDSTNNNKFITSPYKKAYQR